MNPVQNYCLHLNHTTGLLCEREAKHGGLHRAKHESGALFVWSGEIDAIATAEHDAAARAEAARRMRALILLATASLLGAGATLVALWGAR